MSGFEDFAKDVVSLGGRVSLKLSGDALSLDHARAEIVVEFDETPGHWDGLKVLADAFGMPADHAIRKATERAAQKLQEVL